MLAAKSREPRFTPPHPRRGPLLCEMTSVQFLPYFLSHCDVIMHCFYRQYSAVID